MCTPYHAVLCYVTCSLYHIHRTLQAVITFSNQPRISNAFDLIQFGLVWLTLFFSRVVSIAEYPEHKCYLSCIWLLCMDGVLVDNGIDQDYVNVFASHICMYMYIGRTEYRVGWIR